MGCRMFFIRHGQSMGNLLGNFLGITDLDLSPLGYKQAECTANFLKNQKIDAIYSSDLLRAHNTGKALADIKGIEIVDDIGLRELYAGLWENRAFDELAVEFAESYGNVWINDVGNAAADDGESVDHLSDRVYKTIEKIAKENDGKTVAVFTHATPIRAFFSRIQGYTLNEMKNVPWASNASVSEAFYDGEKFKFVNYSRDDFMGDIKTVLPKNC